MLLSTCSRALCCLGLEPSSLSGGCLGRSVPGWTVPRGGRKLLVPELGWCTAMAGRATGASSTPLPASWPRSGCGSGAEPARRAAVRRQHKVHSGAGIHPARGRVGGSLADEVLF